MNLNILGLLLSLNNMELYGGPKWQLKDMSVLTDDVASLKMSILEHSGFSFENFRHNGFNRVGNTGIYASNILRKYIFPEFEIPGVEGIVKDTEKGVVIIFYYEPRSKPGSKDQEDTLHILALREDVPPDVYKGVLASAIKENLRLQQMKKQ